MCIDNTHKFQFIIASIVPRIACLQFVKAFTVPLLSSVTISQLLNHSNFYFASLPTFPRVCETLLVIRYIYVSTCLCFNKFSHFYGILSESHKIHVHDVNLITKGNPFYHQFL